LRSLLLTALMRVPSTASNSLPNRSRRRHSSTNWRNTERKAARLRYLNLRWINALKAYPRVKVLTDFSEPPQAWGVAAVNIEGIDVRDLAKFLMDKYRIIVVPLVGGAPPNQVFDYQALRVSPNIYTTLEEIDTFIKGMEEAVKNGVPSTQASRNQSMEKWFV